MPEIESRYIVDVDEGYDIQVMTGEGTLWIRLTRLGAPGLQRLWSKPRAEVTESELRAMVERIGSAIRNSSPQDRQTKRAFEIWVEGWEFWPGIPAPIGALLRDPGFIKRLQGHPAVRLEGGESHSGSA